jgi:pristinamycin I synthase-3/4
VELVVGLLGIVKSGAAYLPVDPGYPPERIAFLLRDARPAATLITRAVAGTIGGAVGGPAIVLDQADTVRAVGRCPDRDPTDADRVRPLSVHSPAYVIYTSGSTGTPNGVLVGHAGIANLATAQIDRFAITPGSRILQFASPSFDAAVAEVVTALVSGAALVLAPAGRLLPGAPLAELVAAAGVTHVTIPPTVLSAVPVDGLPGVETLVIAGESAPPDLVGRWAGTRRMVNAYGPTEATVCATMSGPLSPDDWVPPIGRPIPGTRAYVLDTLLNPVPVGVVGELHLAGTGLAHGYLNQPARTAERFVPDPFGPPGTRMYRTGDLVRRRPDGDLEFVGRIDDQLTLRGFRVEPGEVEAALARHETVARAAVTVRGERLVGYVVPTPGSAVDSGALRRFVARWLPDHLVPDTVEVLDRLPSTANGKLDRQALPALRGPDRGRRPGRAPRPGLEELLCRLFAEALGRPEVGPDDDFFALGGHSLLAAHLVDQLHRVLPAQLTLRTLFQAPTVAELVERLADPRPTDPFAAMLPIQPGGTRPALFCLPPAAGLSWCYSGLRGHLGADQPIYGLQWSGADAAPGVADSLEQLAAGYLDRIRAVQPTGPYHLLGWSFGGHVAHTAATILQDAGEPVGLLAILDGYPDDPRVSGDARRELAVLTGTLAPLDGETTAALVRTATRHARLATRHAWRRYHGDLLLFVAGRDRTAASWAPYVGGRIEEHEIDCGHFEMTDPDPLAAVGRVVARRLRHGADSEEGEPC